MNQHCSSLGSDDENQGEINHNVDDDKDMEIISNRVQCENQSELNPNPNFQPEPMNINTTEDREMFSNNCRFNSCTQDENMHGICKGASVEVSIYKYQPGIQLPLKHIHNYRINYRGAAITGILSSSPFPFFPDMASQYELLKGTSLDRFTLKDHRAKQLLVVPVDDKFVAVPAPEAFSRHSGTCVILGGQGAYSSRSDKTHELKVGSFLRIGSVGVVVSEIHNGAGGMHKCLSWEELTRLKGDIAAFQSDLASSEAHTAKEDEIAHEGNTSIGSDHKLCYMCFDDEDEKEDNPLVAPCDCKGDTRYVHLNCLQRWHTTTSENKVCVILNNKGVRVCTVCKSPYKSSVRLLSGDSISLFQSPLPPPYICFMVVTKHQNNEDLFSTKYQLSFSSVVNRSGTGGTRPLVIGRSRQCDMVLDYRTVSTRHATIKLSNGGFYFSDSMSSNGSYLYLREPLQLPYGETVYIKWGSNVVSLKAKQSIRHRLSSLVNRKGHKMLSNGGNGPSSQSELSILESLCDMGNESGLKRDMHEENGDIKGDLNVIL
mmetsp:Transcript_2877/g.4329  ORF Transcript_2877/g.4329 Transcript_2877/m.4329 type:complete len:544 (+) Transcript_2877:257-1888(+)